MYYTAVLLLFFFERFLAPSDKKPRPLAFPLPKMEHPGFLVSALLALVTFFVLRIMAIHHAALDPQAPLWYRSAPLTPIDDTIRFWHHPYRVTATRSIASLAVLSCVALFVVHRSLAARGSRREDMFLVGGTCAAMLACGFLAPSLASTDAYLYVGYGKLGLHAYGSQPLAVPCPDPQPNAWCHQPLFTLPAVYGPLFLSYLHAIVGAPAPILHDLLVLRVTNIAWFLLFVALLARLGVGMPIVAIAALNPLFLSQYVIDMHNDIICVDFALAGALAVRGRPWLTALCCIAASSIKLPFALLGALTFTQLALLPRLTWVTITLALSFLTSKFAGGQPYFEAIVYQRHHVYGLASIQAVLALLAALFLIADHLLRRRTALSGAYAIPTLTITAAPYAWYAVWSLPYMLFDRELLARFLIALPFTGLLVETPFQSLFIWGSFAGVTVLWFLWYATRSFRSVLFDRGLLARLLVTLLFIGLVVEIPLSWKLIGGGAIGAIILWITALNAYRSIVGEKND